MRSSYTGAGAAVLAVHRSAGHTFSKSPQTAVRVLEGLGVDGDAHNGVTVKHRTLVRRDPTAPNLRQVHLIHCELFDELRPAGFKILPECRRLVRFVQTADERKVLQEMAAAWTKVAEEVDGEAGKNGI